jgi:UDP-N-acetylglucosamine--N-acetylmuramyl-(pentapeptide) pyrophosphoryl-undecaprenol N-acetylglucosamine transferase
MESNQGKRLLIAASGTGGHLFPALAVAQKLPDYHIEWLGVPDRLETTLVPKSYPLHTICVSGFQKPLGFHTLITVKNLIKSFFQVYQLLKEKEIKVVFTTGGYISAPAILAAYFAKIPVILHESNCLPGKVTRLFSRFCNVVALGFKESAIYLPNVKTIWLPTPVRTEFLGGQSLDLPIPADVPLIVVMGGSQGAVTINKFVRELALNWIEKGAYIVHITGKQDPEKDSFSHPHYIILDFYENMAGLLQRANLVISRAGASALTELAVTQTPSILIPYPYAAENHQFYNAQVFLKAGAAQLYEQKNLTSEILNQKVLMLLDNPQMLTEMKNNIASLELKEGGENLANLIREYNTAILNHL